MSALSAAASDEDGDIIKALRAENEQLRQSLLNQNTVLEMTARAGAHHARAAECLRETVIRWATRAEEAEEMLEAIGAGGVGKMEQPKREPLTEMEIVELRQLTPGTLDVQFVKFARAIERAHEIGGEA